MNAEAHAVAREAREIESKPVLAALCEDIRRAADVASGKRAEQLDTWLAALSRGLRNPRAEDVGQEEADAFRQEWEIERWRA